LGVFDVVVGSVVGTESSSEPKFAPGFPPISAEPLPGRTIGVVGTVFGFFGPNLHIMEF
jgi:hypothetical protein